MSIDELVRAQADSIGIAIPGGAVEMPKLLSHIQAPDWRQHMELATQRGWLFVGCGRAWQAAGGLEFEAWRRDYEQAERRLIADGWFT
ncbi:MAG: hypothetical protein GEV05_27150 [Betaproteobacteria bacterium]|nr:hypothetical protein [Betaproteobacteria bacterium]